MANNYAAGFCFLSTVVSTIRRNLVSYSPLKLGSLSLAPLDNLSGRDIRPTEAAQFSPLRVEFAELSFRR
jgi:hypothetical protein